MYTYIIEHSSNVQCAFLEFVFFNLFVTAFRMIVEPTVAYSLHLQNRDPARMRELGVILLPTV